MENPEIDKYITKRYDRWLDYAKYHCDKAGIADEAVDVLNEVMISLLKREENYILNLLHSKKGQYCELDFYVLRMIKFNATSVTAPYLAKKKPLSIDRNVDFKNLDIEYVEEEKSDKAKEFLEDYQTICRIVDRFDLTKHEKKVFNTFFVMEESISDYDDRTKKSFYAYYTSIKTAVSAILFQEGKIKSYHVKNINKRAKDLINQYLLARIY